jgi:hypothetical protein
MADISFNCPHPECNGPTIVDQSASGLAVKCPHCHRDIAIPAADDSDSNDGTESEAFQCDSSEDTATPIHGGPKDQAETAAIQKMIDSLVNGRPLWKTMVDVAGACIIGWGSAAGVGMIYGFFCAINPLIYFNFIATIVCGLLMGWILGSLLKDDLRCRNNSTLLLALLVCVVLVFDGFSFIGRTALSKSISTPGLLEENVSGFISATKPVSTVTNQSRTRAKKTRVVEAIHMRVEEGFSVGRLNVIANPEGGIPVKGIFAGLVFLLEFTLLGFSGLVGLSGGLQGQSLDQLRHSLWR